MDKNIVFATAGVERIRVKSDGLVGIGTTNPSSLLHLHGTSPNLLIKSQASVLTADATVGSLSFDNNGSGVSSVRSVCQVGGVNNNSALVFSTTKDFDNVNVERMRIDRFGNVGIGTNIPNGSLSIYNPTGAASIDLQSGSNSRFWIFQPTIDMLAIGGTGAGIPSSGTINITSGGGVGIGTNNPGSNLHVYSEQLSSGITIGRAVTDNNDFRDSWIARPHSIITQTGNYSQTNNNGGTIYLNSSHLFHGTWNAWNSGGGVRLIAGSVFSKGNDGSSTGGHEVGGDIVLDSGGVTRLTYGGNGPYTRAGDIHLRTGSVKSVASSAAVDATGVDYTTRLLVSGETGNVGIQTTASYSPLTVKSAMSIDPVKFTVGGTVDKFYPVLFYPVGPSANNPTVHLSRFIHEDATARGAMSLELNWKSWGWGDGAEYWAIKWSYSNNKFLADVQYEWYGGGFVLYLRGATSYFFRGMNAYFVTANQDGNITGANGEIFSPKTTINPDLDYSRGTFDTRQNIHTRDGRVGIGVGNPYYPLQVAGSAVWGITQWAGRLMYDGVVTQITGNYNVSIHASHYMGAELGFITWSDLRIKKDIEHSPYGLSTIMQLRPVSYKFRNVLERGDRIQIGFIAQEVQEVLPEIINQTEDFINEPYAKVVISSRQKGLLQIQSTSQILVGDELKIVVKNTEGDGQSNGKELIATVLSTELDSSIIKLSEEIDVYGDSIFIVGKKVKDFLSIDYDKIIPVLTKAVQEQQQIIQTQNQTIQSLSDRLSKIEAFLSR